MSILCRIIAIAGLTVLPGAEAQDWERIEGLTLPKDLDGMDGDSIPFEIEGRRVFINLYFIDAAENDSGDTERVGEQAEHWKIDKDEVVEKGRAAQKRVEELLGEGFVLHTKRTALRSWDDSERWYGLIQVVGGKYLGQVLVEEELARIKGRTVALPDGTSSSSHLVSLAEAAAKAKTGTGNAAGATTAPTLAPPADVALPETLSTKNPAIVYSDKGELVKIGTLPAGREVEVLGEERLVRVRIEIPGKDPIIGLVRKNDL